MARWSVPVIAALVLAQPAFACREGGAAILFDTAPETRPADLTMVHGRFRSAGPIEIASNVGATSKAIGPYTQIGLAELDSGETVQVFAVLHSCLADIWRFDRIEGDYFMVGRMQGESGQREFLAADRFMRGGFPDGLWTSPKPD